MAGKKGRSGSGGKRPGSGRKKGAPNKATAEIKALAQRHAAAAIKELARLATKAESEAARVAAIRELLDRGYGKATQPISADDDNPIAPITAIEWRIVDPAKRP